MKRIKGVYLGQWLGAEVRVKLTFFLMAVFMIVSGSAMYFGCTLFALILHELAHLLAARVMRVPVNALVLMPFGAMANIDVYELTTPMQMFTVAAAGPVCSLLCACAANAILPLFTQATPVLETFIRTNLLIAGLNLLPAMPLDGGRILMSVLMRHCAPEAARLVPRVLGAVFSAIMIGLAVWTWVEGTFNGWILATGLFLAMTVWREWHMQPAQQALAFVKKMQPQRSGRVVSTRTYAVPWDLTLGALMAYAQPLGYHVFYILDEQGAIAATLDESTLSRLVMQYPANMRLEQMVKAGHI